MFLAAGRTSTCSGRGPNVRPAKTDAVFRRRSVDLIIDVIIDHVTHFFDKAEGTFNKPRVMVVACQMARTIVSKVAHFLAHCGDAYSNPCASLYREIASSTEKIVNRKSES